MNLSKKRYYFPYILLAVMLSIVAIYFYRNIDHYRQLLDLSFNSVFQLVGLILIIAIANGMINYLLYQRLGISLPFGESFGLATVNTLANQLPFAGGLLAKGVYLKQRYNLSYTNFMSATVALYICFVVTNGGIGLSLLAFLDYSKNMQVPILLILGFLGMLASFLLFWIPLNFRFLPEKWNQRLVQMMGGWQILSRNKMLLLKLMGMQALTTLVVAGRFWIAFHVLSQDVTLSQCLLFAAATILTRLVSIAPGGLGVREGIVAGMASILGFEADVSMIAVGLDRLVETVVFVILGTIYTYILSKKATDAEPADVMRSGE